MMKKLIALLLAAMLCLGVCLAEDAEDAIVIRIADESELPEGWAEKDLLRVTVLDMQRSDSILLECGGESMLVDGGLGLFYKRLFRVLDDKGITQLKYLWNTHCDGDHSQGLKCLMNSDTYSGGQLLCPNPENYNDPDQDHQKMASAAKLHGWPYVQIDDGDVFTLGGATITTIRCGEKWGQNNRSAACFVDFGERSIFLTGDIGTKVQNYFVDREDPKRLDCDILKVPHHGIDGVNDVFVNAVNPECVVITNYTDNGASPSWDAYNPYWAGDGVVVLETDGIVWNAWQLPNWHHGEMGT